MIELGLQRISRLLAETPLPWRAIHVAGTNGKGSICAYISSMLETYNRSDWRTSTSSPTLKHARFTSPHLIDRWDCITVNQQTVPFKLFSHIEQRVLRRNEREGIKASEFELLTATAFEIFTYEDIDVAVVEVGLGGRLDATNIIGEQAGNPSQFQLAATKAFRPPPLVTAISKIGLDHQALLGNTLREIAREKAGIMKPGVPVVYDLSNSDEVKTELDLRATPSRIVQWADLGLPTPSIETYVRHLFLASETDPERETASPVPSHSQRNMSVAFRAAWTALQQLNKVPTEFEHLPNPERVMLKILATSKIQHAWENIHFPGRLQSLNIQPLTGRTQDILLDGAHNAQSAEVLAAEVNKSRATPSSQQQAPSHSAVTWVLACSSTKDVTEILRILLQPGDTVFAVEFGPVDGMPWVQPLSSGEIAQAVESSFFPASANPVRALACGRDLLGALQKASDKAESGPMVVAGSLYLVGDVLRLLRDQTVRAE